MTIILISGCNLLILYAYLNSLIIIYKHIYKAFVEKIHDRLKPLDNIFTSISKFRPSFGVHKKIFGKNFTYIYEPIKNVVQKLK